MDDDLVIVHIYIYNGDEIVIILTNNHESDIIFFFFYRIGKNVCCDNEDVDNIYEELMVMILITIIKKMITKDEYMKVLK